MKIMHKGFTIVELLIVIVIIGILAAISIVAYNGVQNKAYNSAVQSDLRQLATKLSLYESDQNRYPSTLAQLESLQFKVSKNAYTANSTDNNLIYCYSTTNDSTYAVFARAKSGTTYTINSQNSSVVAHSGSLSCNTSVHNDAWRGYAPEATPQWRTWTGN